MDNIVVKFDVDTTGVPDAAEQLSQIEGIDKSMAEQAVKTAKAIQDKNKAISESTNASKKSMVDLVTAVNNADKAIVGMSYKKVLTDLRSEMNLSTEQARKFYQNIIDNSNKKIVSTEDQKDLATYNELIASATELLNQMGNSQDGAGEKTQRLTTKLRLMKEELATIDDPNSPRFIQLAQEAAELEDRIGDVNDQVKLLSSDTSRIDALIQTAQGLAGAFAVAQGAVALFGDDNEELQKTLLQVNAAMSILQGLQQVGAILDKNSALNIFLLKTLRLQDATATEAQAVANTTLAAAETTATVATEGATVAQTQLNTAMSLNPAAVLILSITTLIGLYQAFASNADDAAEAQRRFNDSFEAGAKINDEFIDAIKQGGSKVTAELEAEGASAKRIRDAELLNLSDQLKQTQSYLNARNSVYEESNKKLRDIAESGGFYNNNGKLKEATEEEIKELQRTVSGYEGMRKQMNDLQNQYDIKLLQNQAATNKELADAQKEADEKAKQQSEANAQALFEILQRRLQNESELYNSFSESGSFDYSLRLQSLQTFIDKQTALINLQRNHDLAQEGLTVLQKQNINEKYNLELEKLTQDGYTRRNAIIKQKNDEAGNLTAQFNADMLQKQQAVIENMIKDVDSIYDKLKQTNNTALVNKLGELEAKYKSGILSFKQYQEQYEATVQEFSRTDLNNSIASTQAKISNLQYELNAKLITEEQYNAAVTPLIDQLNQLRKQAYDTDYQNFQSNEQKKVQEIQRQAAIRRGLEEAAFNAIKQLFDQSFDDRKAKYDEENQNNQDLFNRKLITQDEYNKRQKKLKQEEAAINKQKAIFDVIIEGAKKIFEIEAQAHLLLSNPLTAAFAPAALAQIPQVIVEQGLALGLIAARGFRKGGFTGNVGLDDVAGVVHGQEFVTHAEATKKYKPALEAMNQMRFDEYLLQLPQMAHMNITDPVLPKWSNLTTSNASIDYDKLGQSIAKHVGRISDIPQSGVNVDEDGLKAWIRRDNEWIEFQNKRYSS